MHEQEIRSLQGFKAYLLRSTWTEVAIVPELGARLLSVKNRTTGREWLWHPGKALKLFRNRWGDSFALSSLTGADECIPTIAPCAWKGRGLPDHGEVWSAAWQLDEEAWSRGVVRTVIEMAVSPLRFERSVALSGSGIRMAYALTNTGRETESFLWALHPLMRIEKGDRLVLPSTTRQMLDGEAWIDRLSEVIPDSGCSKIFAGPLREQVVGVRNEITGDGLELRWTGKDNHRLGLWLTRGGWNGHHHFALEPTNGAPDSLVEAADQHRCASILPGQTKSWEVTITLQTYDKNNTRNVPDAELLAPGAIGTARLDCLAGSDQSHYGVGDSPGK